MDKYFDMLLAGHTIRIFYMYDAVKNFCKDYITGTSSPEFSITITKELIESEREISARQRERDNLPPSDFTNSDLEITAVYRQIAILLIARNIVVFHGSAIEVDGNVYLFTAKSGTGKTTHSKLWLKNIPNAHIINGDKPMLEVNENTVTVYGTPWMGKEGYGKNASADLKAICILERAEQNSIEEITISQALAKLISQTFSDNLKLCADIVVLLSRINQMKSIKFYRLKCNTNDEAAILSYTKMSK